MQLWVEEKNHCPQALDSDFYAFSIWNSFLLSVLLSDTEYAFRDLVRHGISFYHLLAVEPEVQSYL